jgi:hypothetical protein
MTETNAQAEVNTTMTKRNRENSNTGKLEGTPNPKDKKAPRSILKGKVPKENEEETTKIDGKVDDDDEIAEPPLLKRDKVSDYFKRNLGNKFEAAITNEESTAKNHKKESGNEEVKEENNEDEEQTDETQAEDAGRKNNDKTDPYKEDEQYNNTKNNDLDNDNEQNEKGDKSDEKEDKNDDNKNDKDEETKEDKDAMDEDKYCLDLHGGRYKKHTSEWKRIPDGVMKASQVLTPEDDGYITDLIENIAEEMNMKLDKMDKDSWIKTFIKNKDISAARNRRRFIRIFGVSLARSDPKILFDQEIFDGNKLQETKTTMVWAAAYTIYGPGWLYDTIDLGEITMDPTKLFGTIAKSDVIKALPFQATNVYEDNPESLHNLEITMKKICKVKGKDSKEAIEPEIWLAAMTKQFQNVTVQKICLRLAKTPATIFQELKLLNGSELDKIAVTTIWTGAHQLLGHIGRIAKAQKIETPKRKQDKTNEEEDAPSAVKFTPETKVAKMPGNRLFISKAKTQPMAATLKTSKRKFEGYYKVKLPATVNPFGPKAVEETTAHWSNLTEIIWSIDKKAEILPWYENNSVKPLVKSSNEIKTKEQLNKYTPNIYIEQGKNTWLRFHIGHDVNKDKFVDTEAFSEAKLQVSYDKVQAKKTSIWGWMLGGIPETANLNDMKEACENHPILKDFQIEARSQVIRVFSGRQDTPVHLQVKAIHIIGDDRQTAKGRKAFNNVFGSRNDSGYPQQRVMRFVPNIADNRFPATQGRVKDVVKMMGKQKKIMKDARTIYTDTICSLHYYVPQIGYTLCQILMSMRSANDPDTQLFMAVDERTYGSYAVAFTVHKDRMAEATSLIPLLNIVMEAKFGARIWEWFTDTAKDASQGFVYDAETGRIKNTDEDEDDDESSIESEEDNDFVLELSESLNISSAKQTEKGDVFDLDLSFMLDDDNPKNQYGDSGSVKTFRSACRSKKPIDIPDSSDEEDEEDKDSDETKTPKRAYRNSSKLDDPPKTKDKKTEGKSPGDMSVDTSQTQETSTISDSMANPEQAFASMCIQNPDFLARFLQSNPGIKPAVTGESETPAQNKDPQEASPNEDGDEVSL